MYFKKEDFLCFATVLCVKDLSFLTLLKHFNLKMFYLAIIKSCNNKLFTFPPTTRQLFFFICYSCVKFWNTRYLCVKFFKLTFGHFLGIFSMRQLFFIRDQEVNNSCASCYLVFKMLFKHRNTIPDWGTYNILKHSS